MSEMLDPVERALERRIQNRQGTDRRSRVAHRHAPNLKPKPKSKPQAARTLADARAKAATGTTVAGEAAVEGCRVISGSSATNSLHEIKDDAEF